MKNKEPLQPGTAVRHLPDFLHRHLDLLLPDGVVAPGVVVSGVLLASDQLLRVEELAVGPGPHLVDDGGLKVNKDSPGDVLASTGLESQL